MKKLVNVLNVILLQLTLPLHASPHTNSWFRATFVQPVQKKISVDHEWQHRRQNGYQNQQLLQNKLMYSYRTWVHFQANKNLKLSISPFAFFSNYKIIQKPEDTGMPATNEIRLTAAAELQNALDKNIILNSRHAIEYRMFSQSPNKILRLREKAGINFLLSPSIKLGFSYEYLLNLSGTNGVHIFDHQRAGVNLMMQAEKQFRFDIGYIYISRLPAANTDLLYENNFFLNIFYSLHTYP